jgi:hypothetical protein
MSEFRSCQPKGVCASGTLDDAAFCLALSTHALKNVAALADSMVAALYSAGEANACMFSSATEDLRQRIAAAAALATVVAPGDLFTTQADIVHRAFERYVANARTLRTTARAGALACREPLLERFR